jgi:hypothetical protein
VKAAITLEATTTKVFSGFYFDFFHFKIEFALLLSGKLYSRFNGHRTFRVVNGRKKIKFKTICFLLHARVRAK